MTVMDHFFVSLMVTAGDNQSYVYINHVWVTCNHPKLRFHILYNKDAFMNMYSCMRHAEFYVFMDNINIRLFFIHMVVTRFFCKERECG